MPPDVGPAPRCRSEPRPPPPQDGPLRPEHRKKARGVGEEVERGWRGGRTLLDGQVLQLQWADGGDPPKGSWSQNYIWGIV